MRVTTTVGVIELPLALYTLSHTNFHLIKRTNNIVVVAMVVVVIVVVMVVVFAPLVVTSTGRELLY